MISNNYIKEIIPFFRRNFSIFCFITIFINHFRFDDVEYLLDIDDEVEVYATKNSWWNDSGSNISDKKPNKKDKIVKLHKENEWAELDLGWKHPCKPESSEIIFTLDTIK